LRLGDCCSTTSYARHIHHADTVAKRIALAGVDASWCPDRKAAAAGGLGRPYPGPRRRLDVSSVEGYLAD
jgi:hypothetical protein